MEFIKLKKHVGDINEEYVKLVREKMENHERELKAAIIIQKCYRGYKNRKPYLFYKYFIKFAKNRINMLSCIYILKKLRQQRIEKIKQFYMSDNALKIQKCYRGFYSRKYVHDFYKRKREILEMDRHIKEQQKILLLEVEERQKQQKIYENQLKEEKIKKVTKHLHHVVSTKAQRGVYNPKIENIIKEQKKKISSENEKRKEKVGGKNIFTKR